MYRAKLMQQKKKVIQQQNKEITQETNQKLTEQLAAFTTNLEQFAQKYKNEIQFNPDFREQFYTMCLEIGVDPLASISLWSKALNLSEFYYNLAIQIITISMTKGPLIEINELRKMLMNNIRVDKTFDIEVDNNEYKKCIQFNRLQNLRRTNALSVSYSCLRNSFVVLGIILIIKIVMELFK